MSNINLSSYSNQTNTDPNTTILRTLLDMAVAFGPLLTIGMIGEWIGDDTALGALLVNVAYVLSLILATIVLRSRGSGWRKIGLARPKSWPKTILFAIGAMVAGLLAINLMQALLQFLPGSEPITADRSTFDPLTGNLPLLIIYLIVGWVSIALGEEMIFRAFVINSLASLFPNVKAKWTIALLGGAFFFSLIHFSWGFAGMVETFGMGLVLGFIYLRTGRNLWVTIIGHALMITVGFSMIYLGMTF